MATNQGCKGLVPDESLHYKFLYYYLSSANDLLESLGTGATFKELSSGKLKEVPISFPSLEEQRRIVAILDKAFESIAIARANAEKNLQNARELFEGYRSNSFERIRCTCVPRTLDQLATNLDSKRVPITKKDRRSGAYPYYGASGIVDYVDGYIFDCDALLVSEDGANLLSRSTPIAFPVSGKYWVNNHAHILKFDSPTTQRYVEHYLESIPLDAYVTGAAQPKLNQQALNSIPIPIPGDLASQQQLVDSIDAMKEETQRLESIYRRKLAALDELKQSLLHQAFSGQL